VLDISQLTKTQLFNAAMIIEAALPFGQEAAVAALMTAGAESSWLRYANNGNTTRDDVPVKWRRVAAESMKYPHDAVAGEAWTTADSVGLYQQRPMFDYGSIAELMDIAESTRIFLRGSHAGAGTTKCFTRSPVAAMTLAQRCQWTQGSEFPTGENYAPLESVARQLFARYTPAPTTAPVTDWISMATRDEYKADLAEAMNTLVSKVQTAIQTAGTPAIYQLYRGPDGEIIAVYPGGWYKVPEMGVLDLGQAVGLFERNWLDIDANCMGWIKGITTSGNESP
jgi:hypothetical protein